MGQLVELYVVPGVPQLLDRLKIGIEVIHLSGILRHHLILEPSLCYLANSESDTENVVLPVQEYLVPEHRAGLDLKGIAEESYDPGLQEHVARCVGILEILIENGRILSEKLPKDFVGAQYLNRIGHVKIVDQVVLMYHVTKAYEAGLGPRLVNEEHRRQVAHSLHVPDVGTETVESAQYIFQGRAQAVHFLK